MSKANYIAHWPGKDTPVCDEHMRKLERVAAAMGFRLSCTPCDETICPNCEHEAKKAEATPCPKGEANEQPY